MNQIQIQMNAALLEAARPVNPRSHLSERLRARVAKWLPNVFNTPGFTAPDPDKLAYTKVAAIVAIYDDAIARIEAATSDRADAARNQIRAALAPLRSAIDLVDSIGADFNGLLGVDLQGRVMSTRGNLARALAAKELATRSTVDEADREIQRCLADARELDRDLSDIYERLIVPALPDLDALRSAEAQTEDLAKRPGKKPGVVDMHASLDAGRDADPAAAVLWICYEPAEPHALLDLRYQRFAARTGV